MDLNLDEQLAVIVGGAAGIGRAIAEAFAGEGAAVALLDRDPEVEATAVEIHQHYAGTIAANVVDATDYGAVQAAVQQIVDHFGRLDHIVYAAGVGSGKFGFPFWNLEPDDWQRVLQVNLIGAVNVAHVCVPHMLSGRRGTFLMLSSIAGQIGSQTDPPYSAAKAGVINFAQCMAKDLAPHNIRVNTICPGMVKTKINQSVWQAWHDQQPPEQQLSYEQWAERKIAAVTPLGRWQEPADIASLAVFLASDQAKNITGQTLNVDGGQVMHW
ncbi:MAG: SDR family oxidoreductase [Planctomycetales bacterium]|nr:SDR family oxidoreductase [Planctomycetales bacterium]MCA9164813.1 SDR family oxidoreductase [Planctomycetales bacterium]